MYTQQAALTSPPVQFLEGIPMNVTLDHDDLVFYQDHDDDELISTATREYAQDPFVLALANRLEQALESNAELAQEKSAIENDFEDFASAHRQMEKELSLANAMLVEVGLDPTQIWSAKYRAAMNLSLPTDRDPRQLSLDFGGDR
jgi:predicted HAD superfamily Cof-like phosphohydrolase